MPRLLFLGDIMGRPGRDFVRSHVGAIRQRLEADFMVVNAENSAGGAGLNAQIANELTDAGVDAITLGDHAWDQRGFDAEIDRLEQVCRPANMMPQCPGRDRLVIEKDGFRLGIFTVLGQTFMKMKVDCPFRTADRLANELSDCQAILTEIHAEATSEKVAIGWFLDGRVSGVVGTHTHVQTADAVIRPRGTGYLTDAGMSGPQASVIGIDPAKIIPRYLDGMPRRYEVATGDVQAQGVLFTLDPNDGHCTAIEPVRIGEGDLAG